MSTRMIRTLALAVGAGALVLGTAAPAMADDATPNPYKFTVNKGETKTLSANFDPASATPVLCPPGYTWTAWTKQKAIVVNPAAATPSATCTDVVVANVGTVGTLSVVVMDNGASNKKNAVVKLVGTSTSGPKIVKTFVVKVLGQTGNNGKGNKPA